MDMDQYKKGKAVVALVCGIVSCVAISAYLPGWFIGLSCGILAIVFGAIAKNTFHKGIATAGFVLGIIGTSLCGTALVCAGLWYFINSL